MDRYRVKPGTKVDLSVHNPRDRTAFADGKKPGKQLHKQLNERLEDLQELLYAEARHKLLVVVQSMDCGGKDGTIRAVFDGTNPQGVKVAKFGRPTDEELGHDYLWRVHEHTPASGEIVLFNRSHYEDVLVVRVHNLVPPERWRRRYDHINAFEKLLADEGTTILKFFLNISLDEQKQRLQERIEIQHKRWKFRKKDLDERKLWPDYMKAYEQALERTSTEWAPWYIVPADSNWYRNLVISNVLVDTLESLDMRYPEPEDGLDDIEIV